MHQDLGRNLTYGLQEVLGRAIVIGDYAERSFPNEAEIEREHGVSRSVTREAVKMLAAKGLLGARPKQGTFVRPQEAWNLFDPDVLRWMLERKPSFDLLRQFTELRIAVEPQAAALAAIRADANDRAAIGAALARMLEADRTASDPLEADIGFHVAILRATGNPFFLQFRDMVATALRTSIRFTNRIAGRSASMADHQAVHDAILAGDGEGAHDRMRRLISDVLDMIARGEGGAAR